MAKRAKSLQKRTIQKRSPARTAAKKKMLEIKAMKPAQRKKALASK